MKSRPTILVSGMIAANPWQGGATWALLQYILGFRRLGFEVYLVDPITQQSLRPLPSSASQQDQCSLADSYHAEYFSRVMAEFALHAQAALLLSGTYEPFGSPSPHCRPACD